MTLYVLRLVCLEKSFFSNDCTHPVVNIVNPVNRYTSVLAERRVMTVYLFIGLGILP